MKNVLYLFLTLGILISCSKEEQVTKVAKNTVHSRSNQADLVYFYKDKSYPLYFEEGSTEEFVKDEALGALNQITAGKALASFEFSYHSTIKFFYFFHNRLITSKIENLPQINYLVDYQVFVNKTTREVHF